MKPKNTYFHKLIKLWQDWRIFRINRQNHRKWDAEREKRAAIKGKILRVGTVKPTDWPGVFLFNGWEICVANGALPSWQDKDGSYRFAGYTVAELQQIAAAPAEWVDQPT